MITSTGNQQVRNINALMKRAKERRAQRCFVAEGTRMCMEAPRGMLRAVYVSESYIADERHRKALAGCSYEVLSDKVFAAVSDTQTPQGILSVVRMPEYPFEALLDGDRTHLLILESIQDPGNLGTMLRTGEGAGITGVIMNRTTADLFAPKTIRSTMGSIYRLPYRIVDDLEDTLAELRRRGIALYAAHLEGGAAYDAPDYTGACGFLIGNEGNGLSERIAACAGARVRIPMEGQVESLNAAVSAALLMYECSRQRRAAIAQKGQPQV